METELLEKFGLTKTEAKVYLTLLSLGNSDAALIIKKTQLHRTTVYDVLDRLIEKGFVSYVIKQGKKFYIPTRAEKLLDIAREEREKAKNKEQLATQIIKQLKTITKAEKEIVHLYMGKNGLKTIMDNIIQVGENFLGFGGIKRFEDILPIYTQQWAGRRMKKNIKARLIGTEGTIAPIWELNECKTIPKEFFTPALTLIYKNKVAIILLEEPIIVILIESGKIAKSYKNYFEILWEIAERVKE